MTTGVDVLRELQPPESELPFQPYEEEEIVSVAIDFPDFFMGVAQFLHPSMFGRIETQYVIAEILALQEKYGVIPNRDMLRAYIERKLTEDEPFEAILEIVNRKCNPRSLPLIKDTLLQWAKNRAYGQLFQPEAYAAYQRGDYAYIENLVNSASRIAHVGDTGLWFLEQYKLLLEEHAVEHRTTGFPALDKVLSDGGPSPKELLCWLAPTGVGKTITLCNNAISSLKGINSSGVAGQDVMLVTFELSAIKTAMRCLGICTNIPLKSFREHDQHIGQIIQSLQSTYNKRLYIHELPPGECNVSHIYAIMDNLKRSKGWKPDVLIVDYLDLMVSRNPANNNDDYTRQKHVATELRGLAKNENVLVFTATQTNRSASGAEELIQINKAAESFGKIMPMDYIISINQSDADRDRDIPEMQLFVAKNRNGPTHVTVTCQINYNTMALRQV